MEELVNIIADILEVDKERISLDTTRKDLEEWDSLAHIQIISEIESQLEVVIPFEEIYRINKIGDFLEYL